MFEMYFSTNSYTIYEIKSTEKQKNTHLDPNGIDICCRMSGSFISCMYLVPEIYYFLLFSLGEQLQIHFRRSK